MATRAKTQTNKQTVRGAGQANFLDGRANDPARTPTRSEAPAPRLRELVYSEVELEQFEIEKIRWTLEGCSSPMSRIYGTCKALRSTWSYAALKALVDKLVRHGFLTASPHPLREDEFFYSLAKQRPVLATEDDLIPAEQEYQLGVE